MCARLTRRLLLALATAGAVLACSAPVAGAVTLASPAAGATVSGSVGIVTREAAGEDAVRVELQVDGNPVGSAYETPFSILWDTRSVANGAHTLRLATYASTGGVTLSPTVGVTVANSAGGGLAATYFPTRDLTGNGITQVDPVVNFDWKRARPVDGIGYDNFSVRWTGMLEAPTTDVYVFHVDSDDGVRLWVDGRLLIDEWHDRSGTIDGTAIPLTAGAKYHLKLEYFDHSGDAHIHLRWSTFHTGTTTIPSRVLTPTVRESAQTRGLRAVYYASTNFTGRRMSRVDPVLRFDWQSGSPDGTIASDQFSARWTGRLIAPRTGKFTFFTRADDGVRVWVGGRRLIGDWHIHPAKDHQGTITLRKGVQYAVRIDYFEAWGTAQMQVDWSGPRMRRQALPTRNLLPAVAPPEPPKPTTGLIGTYYDNGDLTGEIFQQLDNTVDFDWADGSPDSRIWPDTFSARWTGRIVAPQTGRYTIKTKTDDGVRLFLGGQLAIDDWKEHNTKWNYAQVDLVAGQPIDVELQYMELFGGAKVRLAWNGPGVVDGAIPTQNLLPVAPSGPPLRPQTPAAPAPPTTPQWGLWGVYYDDLAFGGTTVVGRTDSRVYFDWGTGRPTSRIEPGTYSVRWTGTVAVPTAGAWKFRAHSDDGVRVWVDGQPVIDDWTTHADTTDTSAALQLASGRRYDIRVEYFQGDGPALVKLSWIDPNGVEATVPSSALRTPGVVVEPPPPPPPAPPPPPPTPTTPPPPPATRQPGMWGVYFGHRDFTGAALGRVDAPVNFDWGTGSPMTGIGADDFAVRWTGTLTAPDAQSYRIYTRADDGVRLWLDGRLLIDHWVDQSPTLYSTGLIALGAGTAHDLKVEYYENGGGAAMQLSWATATLARTTIPASALQTPGP